VLVVGGGPAGLGAARNLASRGHRVVLWEASASLGGLLRSAAGTDPVLARYLEWLVRQVEQAGTEVRLGHAATAEAVRAEAPDVVVVATGARWDAPSTPGADRPSVATLGRLAPWFADPGGAEVGRAVVVLGGGTVGLSVAGLCRARGIAVTVVEPTTVLGVELGLPGRFRIVADLRDAGARLVTGAEVLAIDDRGVRVTTDGAEEHLEADTVIVASGATPDDALASELRDAGIRAHTAGDARAVRLLEGAELDATEIALSVT
jgi:2,4-dienoyl-CoA reductase (NADPH2)